jgi:antitoxin (DNA-binding transcriptional repressor) of toxin-antitoxin stability system
VEGGVHDRLHTPAYQTRIGKQLCLLDFPGAEEARAVIKVNLKDAEGDLEHLVEEAAGGEEVILTRGDGARFRIVPLQPTAAAGQEAPAQPGVIGSSLDHYMGLWSAEEADEFLKATEVFEEIDESLWS